MVAKEAVAAIPALSGYGISELKCICLKRKTETALNSLSYIDILYRQRYADIQIRSLCDSKDNMFRISLIDLITVKPGYHDHGFI